MNGVSSVKNAKMTLRKTHEMRWIDQPNGLASSAAWQSLKGSVQVENETCWSLENIEEEERGIQICDLQMLRGEDEGEPCVLPRF